LKRKLRFWLGVKVSDIGIFSLLEANEIIEYLWRVNIKKIKKLWKKKLKKKKNFKKENLKKKLQNYLLRLFVTIKDCIIA
jgi:hypothetical protein